MTSIKLLDLQQFSHKDPLQRLLAAYYLLQVAQDDLARASETEWCVSHELWEVERAAKRLERAAQVEREHSSGELEIT